ncbi:MAG TPA: ABC transporter permease [Candidatus Babeliales bacterium]|nr:ABC transporter permease [Candidatus Babeliales bacterium]
MKNQLRIAFQLFLRDMMVLKKDFLGLLVNTLVWPVISAILFGFILPHFGSGHTQNFGSFMIAGTLVAIVIVTALQKATDIIVDIQHQKLINFERTLPLSFGMLVLQKITTIASISFFYSVIILVVGKIILWNRFSLELASFPWLFVILILANFFFASFALIIAGWIPTSNKMDNVWMRLYMPALWFGSYMNTWYEFYKMLPSLAIFMLFNPVTYCMEGLRAAMFGQVGYISLWIVLGALSAQFTIACLVGIYFMKRKLNAI